MFLLIYPTCTVPFSHPTHRADVLFEIFHLEAILIWMGSFLICYLVWARHGRSFVELYSANSLITVMSYLELLSATCLVATAGMASKGRSDIFNSILVCI